MIANMYLNCQVVGMKNAKISLLISLAAICAGGCVKENLDDCPDPVVPEPTPKVVRVAVRDKNYDNAEEAPGSSVDENLPIREYISTLFTRTPLREEVLTHEELTHEMPADRFQTGLNRLELFGHADEDDIADGSITLHPGGIEGRDIYVGADTLTIPLAEDRTVWMLRAKGRLMVDIEGMPDSVETVTITVRGVRESISLNLNDFTTESSPLTYAGETSVSKIWHTSATGGDSPFSMLLAPSVTANESEMVIDFAGADGAIITTVTARIGIARNHITRVKATYNARNWTIIVLVNGSWRHLDDMIIDEEDAATAN